ncbi:MAG: polysaccharide biosynthesis C-terminal domain-containing protein, partial [Candidatus Sedimenticola sp. (ex Thyasira tokunagai)]
LALATTLSACLNAFLLYRGLRRELVYVPADGWPLLILRGAFASIVMGAVLFWGGGDLDSWVSMESWERVMRLFELILAGGAAYFVVLFAVGIRLRHFRGSGVG